MKMDDNLNIREYIETVLKNWWIIVALMIVFYVIAFIASSIQQPIYQAKISVLVRSGSSSTLSQIGNFANAFGINLSYASSSQDELIELLKSRAVAKKVIQDLDLRSKIKGWDDPDVPLYRLAEGLGGVLKEPKSNGNVVEIIVEYKEPQLTMEMANGFADALSYYWNNLNYSAAKKKRAYIETQLPRVSKELEIAQRRLKNFTILSPKASISSASLNSIISGSQRQGMEVSNLAREFEIQNSVYVMLRKEYETVKLEESREIPPFSILDEAILPLSPVRPNKKLNSTVGLVFGLFSGIMLAFIKESWKGNKK
jgi:uncharacterized protein involved in exopolysaccharide biosynthesis